MTADRARTTSLSKTLLVWLTIGVMGTALFPIIYVIEGATRPDYDPWRQAISALSLGPEGWIQRVDFALCGVSVLWSAYVWRRMLSHGVCATWYPLLRGVEGAALLMIAVFSQDPGFGYPPGTPEGPGHSTLGGTLHLVFTIVIVNFMCFALFVIARRFWRNPQWRGWVVFTVACGFWPMVFMSLFGVALNTHSMISGYAGLFERIATNADTVWSLALVARLWARRPVGL